MLTQTKADVFWTVYGEAFASQQTPIYSIPLYLCTLEKKRDHPLGTVSFFY